MPQYLIFFNQQWVGDHPAEWYEGRGVLARAVVRDMKAAGVLVIAGGLEEDIEEAFFAHAGNAEAGIDGAGIDGAQPDELRFGTGPFARTEQWIGGMTIVDVADDNAARHWAGRIAVACGWPQEVRRFKPDGV